MTIDLLFNPVPALLTRRTKDGVRKIQGNKLANLYGNTGLR